MWGENRCVWILYVTMRKLSTICVKVMSVQIILCANVDYTDTFKVYILAIVANIVAIQNEPMATLYKSWAIIRTTILHCCHMAQIITLFNLLTNQLCVCVCLSM